jgi:two-component system response regulator DesR
MSNGAITSGKAPISVLICDDNAAMRELLRAVVDLRPTLRVVGEAGDGNAAIVEATRLQPDVILLDLAMPRRTGLESLLELGRVAPAARIIVFSGFSTASVADEVADLGAVRFLSKGANPDAINDAIEEVAAEPMPNASVAPSSAQTDRTASSEPDYGSGGAVPGRAMPAS